MFSVSKCDCKPTSVSLKLSYGAFFNAFFKMIRVSHEVFLHLTWKFKPFIKCFLSQNVTANFSLMLLQFSPCVWKARKVSRLARKVKDVFRFVDHFFKYKLYSHGLDSQKDFSFTIRRKQNENVICFASFKKKKITPS